MKREIKFRVWDKIGQEMTGWEKITDNRHLLANIFLTDFYDVMQFTGLTDSTGNDVFEGDIVEVTHPKLMGYVGPYFDEVLKDTETEMFAVEHRDKNTIDGGFGAFYLSGKIHIDFVRKGKVVGSIYQNPELLK